MAGRRNGDGRPRLASGRQLWTLNSFGRLRVVDDGYPITSNRAKDLIAAEFERRSDPADERAARSASRQGRAAGQ
jgi:hypothetical protein